MMEIIAIMVIGIDKIRASSWIFIENMLELHRLNLYANASTKHMNIEQYWINSSEACNKLCVGKFILREWTDKWYGNEIR